MSVEVIGAVWEQSKTTGTDRLVLLAIADHADGKGVAWPSVPRLARMCATTERHVRRILSRLRRLGELEITGGRGPHGCNLYRITVGANDKPAPLTCPSPLTPTSSLTSASPLTGASPLTPESTTPDLQVREPLTPRSAEPSLNRQGTANKPPLPPKGGKRRPAEPLPPPPHPKPEFAEAWERWLRYRRELRKPLAPSTVRAQLADLAALSCADAIAAIDQSIRNGWSGLFKPNGRGWDPRSDRQPLPRLVENIQIKELT